MPTDKNLNPCTAPWHVLCHLNPTMIETLLKKESEGMFSEDGMKPSPFRFYIPYLYMPVAEQPVPYDSSEVENTTDESRDLRNDFHNFVFIQATAARVDSIVNSRWNTTSRLRLHYYRDHERKNIVVADSEVRKLMDTFRDKTLKFFVGQPIDEFSAGDRVILNTGSWAGQKGLITDIRLKRGQLHMTISLNIFNRMKSINFTDLKVGDIIFEDPDKSRLLNVDPVSRFEEEILDILSHSIGKTADSEVIQTDKERLRRLSTFDRIFVEETDTDYARILSLRLICAVLRKSSRRESLQRQLLKLLNGKEIPTTDDEAYMMTALFISTRHAAYRNAVKAYRNTHPEAPDILRRYHSIVKKMRGRYTICS